MKAIPKGVEVSFDKRTGADVIEDVNFHRGRLDVLTYASIQAEVTDTEVRYKFEYVEGMLLLDEGNLITLWEDGTFQTGHILYEIVEGSVFERISSIPGILSVSLPRERLGDLREFLISSQDDCLLVLTQCEPEVTAGEYHAL